MTLSLLNPETDSGIPFVQWADVERLMDWKQGEHVTIIGPTGQGKSTLALQLIRLRTWQLILATKPQDATLEEYVESGDWVKVKQWPAHSSKKKVILWPDVRGGDTSKQREAITAALRSVYDSGGWTVLIDELWHATNILKLERIIQLLFMQGRSLHVSVMVGAQRPAHVPLIVYDQATHLFLFGDRDEANIRRMGGLGWFSKREIMREVSSLRRHETLYINTREGAMMRTMVPV